MLALTGTPVNVLVSNAAIDAGLGSFGFFEFALAGVPLLVGTVAIIVVFGEKLLPQSERAEHAGRFQPACQTLGRAIRTRRTERSRPG